MKIISRLRSVMVAMVILGIAWSCQQDEELKPLKEKKDIQGKFNLGKKLENPYSVENMQKAYESLLQNNSNARLAVDEDFERQPIIM